MTSRQFEEIFQDCIHRMQQGETLESCLYRYPDAAPDLRHLLETVTELKMLGPSPAEIATATARMRNRVSKAVYAEPITPTSNSRLFSFMLAAALLVIAFMAGYLLNRWQDQDGSERSIVAASGLSETRRHLDNGDLAEVMFEGRVVSIQGNIWQIEGILVHVPADTVIVGQPVTPGTVVEVEGYTTPRYELFALRITRLSAANDGTPLPDLPASTLSATATPTLTASSSPTTAPCMIQPTGEFNVAIRQGGGVNYPTLGELPSDEIRQVVGYNPANEIWYAIIFGEDTGWVSSAVTTLSGECSDLEILNYPAPPPRDISTPGAAEDSGSGRDEDNSGPGNSRDDDRDEHDDDDEFEVEDD